MAVFEPTEAEKAAESYLDWDDAELGKFTKYVALKLRELQKDDEGVKRVSAAACSMMLVGCCVDTNAAELSLNFGGFTHKDKPVGDWTLVVKKKKSR